MGFLRDISPRRAITDLRDVLFRPDQPYRWRFLAAAMIPPAIIFSYLLAQEFVGPPPRPEILYFESWELGRSDEEIMAGNIEASKAKAKAEALAAARLKVRRDAYKSLGRAFGLDVDQIERDAIAEDARVKADRKRQLEAWRNGGKPSAESPSAESPPAGSATE